MTKIVPVGILVCALSALAVPVFAKDNFTLAIGEQFILDSNPLMSANDIDDLWGFETKLKFGYKAENLANLLNTEMTLVRNQMSESAYNSSDLYWDFNYTKKFDLWLLGLSAGIDYDTTREGEVTFFGQNLRAERRFSSRIAPRIAYSLSPRSQLSLSGAWDERQYENDALTDYRTLSFSPTVSYKLTPLQTASLSIKTRRYEALDGPDLTVDSIGPYFGWQNKFHSKYSLDIYAGFQGTKYDGSNANNDDWDYNPIYALGLSYDGLRNQTRFDVSRSRQAYANGTESDFTSLSLSNNYAITPLWMVRARALYQEAKHPVLAGSDLDNAIEESLAISYEPAKYWDISLSQKYRKEEFVGNREEADRHIIRFGITYNFNRVE